jgi:hypothetical protein
MIAAPLGLTAVSVALCCVIAGELSDLGHEDAYPAFAQHTPGVAGSPAEAADPPNQRKLWLDQILARPLFNPDRRPMEAGVVGLPRLTGIVVAGSQRVAIFAATGNQHPITAEAGAHVGAYQILTIADDGVTVAGPEGTTLIRPIFDTARVTITPPLPSVKATAPRPGVR